MSSVLDHVLEVQAALGRTPRPTHAEIALEIGLGRSRVSNLARLLDLPPPVLDQILAGRLSPKAGEWLLRLPSSDQIAVADQAVRNRWTIARLRKAIELRQGKRGDDDPNPDPNLSSLEGAVGSLLGARVQIDYRADGTGWMKIRFTDLDTLDGVLERIGYRG